jgi:protein phosphatase PTC7
VIVVLYAYFYLSAEAHPPEIVVYPPEMRLIIAGGFRVPALPRNSIGPLTHLHSPKGRFLRHTSSLGLAHRPHANSSWRWALHHHRLTSKSLHSGLSPASTKAGTSSSTTPLSFHVAASASGKGRRFRVDHNTHVYDPDKQDALGLQLGETRAQKRLNRPDSGQDAFFIAKLQPHSTAFGIADGVGGWATSGVDPAEFSHGFCHYMAQTTLEWTHGRLTPRMLMEIGYQNIIDDPTVPAGGSTACVGIAGPDGALQIANLGDSGFLQLRLGAVHHYSNPQTHAFNTPYQLSIIPPKIIAQSILFGGMPLADLPEKAEISHGQLRHGDVLILATDGVWDNLNAQEVLNIVSSQMRSYGAWVDTGTQGLVASDQIAQLIRPTGLNEEKGQRTIQGVIAAAVAGEAKTASLNTRRDGPFAREVQKHYPEEGYRGGKVDDICVIALLAVEDMTTRANG